MINAHAVRVRTIIQRMAVDCTPGPQSKTPAIPGPRTAIQRRDLPQVPAERAPRLHRATRMTSTGDPTVRSLPTRGNDPTETCRAPLGPEPFSDGFENPLAGPSGVRGRPIAPPRRAPHERRGRGFSPGCRVPSISAASASARAPARARGSGGAGAAHRGRAWSRSR